MAQRNGKGLIPPEVLEGFKNEIGNELGIIPLANEVGWSELPSKYWGRIGGRIGGRMVRVMVKHAEEALLNGAVPPEQ